MSKFNKICLTIAIVCIVVGAVFGLALVWLDVPNEFTWRCFLSLGILFGASMLAGLAGKVLLKEEKEGG